MTSLLSGIHVIAAPRFHIEAAWPERLSLNSGIAFDDRHVYPRTDWRPPSQAELDLLTTSSVDPKDAIQLFSIPDRLRTQWWLLAAESSSEVSLEGPAFRKFANDVHEYLHFKQLPLSSECAFEMILTAPGQPSTQLDAGGLLEQPATVLLGGINFSDEAASVIFLNLHRSSETSPAANDEQQRSLLLENRDYPLTRMKLQPGEGYWLPRQPIIMDRDTWGRTEIDVHLAIRQAP
jgi:hypothetical protein